MARSISVSDAKNIIGKHRELLARLEKEAAKGAVYSENVIAAAEALAEREAQKLLATIPVEELNREKLGIRVKNLREKRFETMAQIEAATVQRIASVDGISDEGARLIKRKAREYADSLRAETRIRLSADDRNMQATRLVETVCAYKFGIPACNDCSALIENYKTDITKAISAAAPAAGTFKWMFASKSKRAAAEEAYEYLAGLFAAGYEAECQNALPTPMMKNIPRGEKAWADFSADPIAYYNILEKLVPERFSSDSMYGLPEDLARQISEQELNLEGLNCTLRRYQEWGVKYIIHQKKALLGDEMGLGKTVQAIAAMVALYNTGATHFMVVCPASVVTNWCREIKKFSGINVVKIHGADRAAALEKWKAEGGAAVTTFETTALIRQDQDFACSMVIVDEAHYIKNPKAQRTENTRSICERAERILFMTGTALENDVDEMVELVKVLDGDVANQVRSMAFMASAPQFREKVAPVYYRRRRDDVLKELPELIENMDWCTIGGEEEKLYERAVLDGKFTDARRVSWSVDDLNASSKAMRLKEIIEDAEEDGRKVIVFSFFLDTVNKIATYFGDRCMPIINGSVTPQRRQEIIDEFEKAPAGAVLIAQIQSGGTGLNIQTASVVVLCEPQFKPSIENQAISRAYRMGQSRSVLVHRLLCDDTVDERIVQILEQKQKVFDAFADESAVAEESLEIDPGAFGDIMDEEAKRIREKQAAEN